MRKSILSLATATVLLAGVGVASAQTTIATTTWTNEHGTVIREYSTVQKYTPFVDPAFKVQVGTVLPGTVTVAPLPPTIVVPQRETYRYAIINNTPVVVDSGRKVIHLW